MTNKSVVFSGTMEKKFLALAMNEGAIHVPESYRNFIKTLKSQNITREDVSHIQANLFLNPHLRLQLVYELEFESEVTNLAFEMQREYNDNKEFKDVLLLCSLVIARNPSLTIEEICDRLLEHLNNETKVIESFGAIPSRQSNGVLCTFDQSIRFVVTQEEPPKATKEQQLLFEAFEKSLDKVEQISDVFRELTNLYRRVNVGDSVVIDPLLKNTFTDFLDEEYIKNDQLEKVDLFYLFIKELKTLPIGRNIKETIELANSKEGDALRKRIGELHGSIVAGELSGIDKVQARIRDDIHEYKLLTSKLISPNKLSDLTDLTLSATSLIPVVGTATGALGLAKTTASISQKRSIYKKIQESIWVEYRGDTI